MANHDFLTVTTSGANITTGAASTSINIPVCSSGEIPTFIRVASTNACYVKMGVGSATASANDLLIQPADSAVLSVPRGVTRIAAIQDSAAGKVSIVPLEFV